MTTAGQTYLQRVKAAAGLPESFGSIPVGDPRICTLRPVATCQERLNASDVECLTEWRNRFVTSFLTEFIATGARTENWLLQTVGPDDTRALFMVDDLSGRSFGYMGIAFIDWTRKYGEADAVVRGGEAPPGVMSRALIMLLEWARTQLGLQEIGVRVRSDNPALEFYRKLGFREQHRVSMRRTVHPDRIVWSEDPSTPSGICLVHMKWMG